MNAKPRDIENRESSESKAAERRFSKTKRSVKCEGRDLSFCDHSHCHFCHYTDLVAVTLATTEESHGKEKRCDWDGDRHQGKEQLCPAPLRTMTLWMRLPFRNASLSVVTSRGAATLGKLRGEPC